MQDMLNIGYHRMAGAGGLKKREIIEATSSGKMFYPLTWVKRLFPTPQKTLWYKLPTLQVHFQPASYSPPYCHARGLRAHLFQLQNNIPTVCPRSPSLDSIVLSVVLLKYYSGHVLLMLGPLTLNVQTPQHRNQGPVDTKLPLLHLSLMSHCLLPARHSFNKLYLHMPFLSCANFYTIKKKNTPFKYMICKDFLKTSS